ncbi:MAG: radical SAM protein [Elusimicrobia bacterium]|nr:radical SAM protein [Elusimicrobiota bacterium]
MSVVLPESLGAEAADLKSPLYAAWQLTNECDLRCRHCIEGSGPGEAFPDELSSREAFRVADELIAGEVPYVAFSGGEPLLHPGLFDLLDRFRGQGVGLKLETNGQRLDPATCGRLADAQVKAVQVSLDGTSAQALRRLRPKASLRRVVEGIRSLREAGVAVEVNFAPTRFNVAEVAGAMDLAVETGAYAFYTGRLMYTGRAVSNWDRIAPSEAQYAGFFAAVKAKAREYEGRLRVCYHELGIVEELRTRAAHPAALIIILPDGRVKLINALPFTCGDLRRQSLCEVWAHYQRAWKDPRVKGFIDELAKDEKAIAKLHDWVAL